jgi:hypothetical protein
MSIISLGQDRAAKTWQHDKKNCHFLLSNTHQCNWQFFEMKRKLNGVLVTIDKPPIMQKVVPAATVCIVATSKDTVRVIVEGIVNGIPGDKISFIPAKEPEYDVQVSFDREYYFSEEKKKNNPTCRVNKYDQLIMRTTWGSIAK